MSDYLKGYLQVLPEFQRKTIKDIIVENQDLFEIKNVSDDEFKKLMDQLAKDHEQLTKFIAQYQKLDPDLWNNFFSNLYIDLNLMFLESNLSESAIVNYHRIFESIISDLKKEIDKLSQRIDELKLVNEGEEGLIVKSYDFTTKGQMETDRGKYGHLFQDRDGTQVSNVVIERNHDQYFAALGKRSETDCLKNQSGQPTAKIKVIDRRGKPIEMTKNPERYAVSNSIDGSNETYWAEVVLADEPIKMSITK